MRDSGFLFAIVEKASGRTIGEVCLQWMNLERAKIDGEKIMRLPIGIWDKTLWGRGYGKEVVRCLMAHAFGKLGIDRFCPGGRSRGQRPLTSVMAVAWTNCFTKSRRRKDVGL